MRNGFFSFSLLYCILCTVYYPKMVMREIKDTEILDNTAYYLYNK